MITSAATLEASPRDTIGKGFARRMRVKGRIPGIIYGSGKDEVRISLETKTLHQLYLKGRFFSKIVTLTVDGRSYQVLPKSVQLHPVSDMPEHADFLHVEEGSNVFVKIPIRLLNADKCVGVKRGGRLSIIRRHLLVECKPHAIPEALEIDLTHFKIGESMHIEHITFPEGVAPTKDKNAFAVARIAGKAEAETVDVPGADKK